MPGALCRAFDVEYLSHALAAVSRGPRRHAPDATEQVSGVGDGSVSIRLQGPWRHGDHLTATRPDEQVVEDPYQVRGLVQRRRHVGQLPFHAEEEGAGWGRG